MAKGQQKRCPRCEVTFPHASEAFHRNRAQSDGFAPYCKACKKATRNPSEQAIERGRERSRERMRRRRVEEPEKVKAEKDAYYQRNKERILAKDREYYYANIEARRMASREWHAENREDANARRRAHYHANDGAKAAREWRTENSERHRATRGEYRKSNPEKVRVWDATKRAKRRAAKGRHTAADILQKYEQQKGRCWWCHKHVGANYHVDHVVALARGGTNNPENIVISCPRCNMQKHDKLPHEWNGRLL